MGRVTVMFVLSCSLLSAQYRESQLAVLGATAMDAHSSWQRPELNPLLAHNGKFTGRSLSIKLGVAGAFLGVGHLIQLKWPGARKHVLKANFAFAGVTGATAASNYARR